MFGVRQSRLISNLRLVGIFDSLFRRSVEAARDIAGSERLGHHKDRLKSSHVVASRADAKCWTAIHKLCASLSVLVCVSVVLRQSSDTSSQTLPRNR
jgi:hypothetical protein